MYLRTRPARLQGRAVYRGPMLARFCALLAVIGLALLAASAGAPPLRGDPAECGLFRWSVKTLADGEAREGDLLPPRTAAVRALAGLPLRLSLFGRRPPVETTTYRITVRLVGSFVAGDQDIHLLVADPAAPRVRMIVEFPDPHCTTAAAPAARQLMSRARASFLAECGTPRSRLTGTATVTGVGFLDVPHSEGGAPNGIELHPVVGFASRDCA